MKKTLAAFAIPFFVIRNLLAMVLRCIEEAVSNLRPRVADAVHIAAVLCWGMMTVYGVLHPAVSLIKNLEQNDETWWGLFPHLLAIQLSVAVAAMGATVLLLALIFLRAGARQLESPFHHLWWDPRRRNVWAKLTVR